MEIVRGESGMTESRSFTFVSTGKVPPEISVAVRDAVAAAKGERLKLTLSLAKKFSSDPQRAYYFAVIIPRIQGLLLSGGGKYIEEEVLHDWLMWNVGKWTKTREGARGEKMMVRRSYTDLSTVEAEEHHLKCRAWAAKRGCDIPEPNEITP